MTESCRWLAWDLWSRSGLGRDVLGNTRSLPGTSRSRFACDRQSLVPQNLMSVPVTLFFSLNVYIGGNPSLERGVPGRSRGRSRGFPVVFQSYSGLFPGSFKGCWIGSALPISMWLHCVPINVFDQLVSRLSRSKWPVPGIVERLLDRLSVADQHVASLCPYLCF